MKRITTERDYEKALTLIEALIDTPDNERDNALMERLSEMVTAYEEEHYAIEPPAVAAALEFRMEQEGLSQAEVSRLTGIPKSRISEILSGSREPSKDQIKALHNKLGIPLHHLLGEADDCDGTEVDSTVVTAYPDFDSHDLYDDYKFMWDNDDADDAWQYGEKVLADTA